MSQKPSPAVHVTAARRLARLFIPVLFLAAFALLVLVGYIHDTNARALRTDLFTAVQIGTPVEVKELLDRGGDPNARETREDDEQVGWWERVRRPFARRGAEAPGGTLLEGAALDKHHSYKLVNLLLDRGARASDGDPLFGAADSGDLMSAAELIKRGAKPSRSNALYWAARGGNLAMVKLLVEAGADVNRPDGEYTPLDGAVLADSSRCVGYLINRGARVTQSAVGGSGATLGMLISTHNMTIARMLTDAKASEAGNASSRAR